MGKGRQQPVFNCLGEMKMNISEESMNNGERKAVLFSLQRFLPWTAWNKSGLFEIEGEQVRNWCN